MAKTIKLEKLAIRGGPKAKTTPNIPMYPGGLAIGKEEKKQVLEVLERNYLFRYYGPKDYPSKVGELEKKFGDHLLHWRPGYCLGCLRGRPRPRSHR